MRTLRAIVAMFTLVVLAGLLSAAGQTDWQVKRTIQIGGEGGWDYLTVDPLSHRIYVPRTTHTMVIDPGTGKVIADIPGQRRAHGVAIVPEAGRGFISDGGGDGAIVIFNLKTNAVLGTIAAQPDADGIIFDPASKRVLVVSGDGGTLMSLKPDVDPKSGKIDAPIELGGKPEFLASDGKGKIYVNLVDKDEVVVVDIAKRKVLARWPVTPGGTPVGMSMDQEQQVLFVGCRKPAKLIVMSAQDGKVLADIPIGPGVDATKFANGQAFASSGDGTLAVAGEKSKGKFEIMESVKTLPGARTMGIDPTSHTIYLPTAEFEEQKPGATGRPVPKPGTFVIVVVAPR